MVTISLMLPIAAALVFLAVRAGLASRAATRRLRDLPAGTLSLRLALPAPQPGEPKREEGRCRPTPAAASLPEFGDFARRA